MFFESGLGFESYIFISANPKINNQSILTE